MIFAVVVEQPPAAAVMTADEAALMEQISQLAIEFAAGKQAITQAPSVGKRKDVGGAVPYDPSANMVIPPLPLPVTEQDAKSAAILLGRDVATLSDEANKRVAVSDSNAHAPKAAHTAPPACSPPAATSGGVFTRSKVAASNLSSIKQISTKSISTTAVAAATASSSSSRRVIVRASRRLKDAALGVLREWFLTHQDHPYPSRSERERLAAQINLKPQQVGTWFVNVRKRIWIPDSEADVAVSYKSYLTKWKDMASKTMMPTGQQCPPLRWLCDYTGVLPSDIPCAPTTKVIGNEAIDRKSTANYDSLIENFRQRRSTKTRGAHVNVRQMSLASLPPSLPQSIRMEAPQPLPAADTVLVETANSTTAAAAAAAGGTMSVAASTDLPLSSSQPDAAAVSVTLNEYTGDDESYTAAADADSDDSLPLDEVSESDAMVHQGDGDEDGQGALSQSPPVLPTITHHHRSNSNELIRSYPNHQLAINYEENTVAGGGSNTNGGGIGDLHTSTGSNISSSGIKISPAIHSIYLTRSAGAGTVIVTTSSHLPLTNKEEGAHTPAVAAAAATLGGSGAVAVADTSSDERLPLTTSRTREVNYGSSRVMPASSIGDTGAVFMVSFLPLSPCELIHRSF